MKTHLNNTKLIQSLRLLSPDEFKTYHKWLQSPWANSNGKLVEFYQILQRCHPDYTGRNLTKEKIFAKLYPQKKYDDKWMRNIMAAMSKQVEKFLVHQRLEKDRVTAKELLAKEYLERHQANWYIKKVNEIINELELKTNKESEDYLKLSLLHENLYHQSDLKADHVSGHYPLKIAELYLDTFFSTYKWRLINEMVERKLILPEDWSLSNKKELLISLTRDLDIPINKLYQERIEMAEHLQKDKYFSFKEKYLSVQGKLPKWDSKLLFFYLINSAARLWMKGNQEIIFELLDLYKTGLENKTIFYYGRLTDATYANIVNIANSCDDVEFSLRFIEEFTDYLPPEKKEDGKTWALGKCFYKKQEYEKSIELLSAHSFKNNMFNTNGRFVLLQSYFDACMISDSYFLFFKDYCEATKKYFKRNKPLSKERNMALITAVNYALRIIKLFIDRNHIMMKLEKIESDLNKEKNIQGKRWLLGKLVEIKNGPPP
ncbi:MAG: hypothetical protein AAFZ15_08585 [Bacteroidota bacterium]